MEVRRSRVSSAIRTEGGLLPADLLGRIASGDQKVAGLKEADYGLETGVRFGEAITRSWNRVVGGWTALAEAREAAGAGERLTTVTRERFLLPLFEELGFRLAATRAVEIEGSTYPVSHADRSVPVHLVSAEVPLDKRTPGVRGAAGAAPHALVQELLNRSGERLWGFVSNGRTLRLLRDNSSLTRQAYLEFDLEAILTGQAYADFSLLWLVCHRSRFEGARPEDWIIERWTRLAADEGTRALESLRGGVTSAIETLGAGFLAEPANTALRERLRSGELDRQDYYRQLLRLVYRLIFLFTAEDRRDEGTGRELLLDPKASDEAVERYRSYYSTARLRVLAVRRRGTRHTDLWASLRRVVAALGGDTGAPSIALPALGSFLFGPDACADLEAAELRNEDLLTAVRQLATIEEDRRLRTVDYANLGAEELGSVYESLLELHPRLEMEATPPVFSLATAAGHERKVTGSYYTPSSLINCLLDSALDPVLEEAASKPDPEKALLELWVVDPAAGSGHFLVMAAHRIAKRLAAIRTGEGEPPPPAVRHALRDVISHCIYAVDINPMAVELCKVSLWLEALEPGKPLTFLDHHIKCGNSLVWATATAVANGIPDSAYTAVQGDDKRTATAWRHQNEAERGGQLTLAEASPSFPITDHAAAQRRITDAPETDQVDARAKASAYEALRRDRTYQDASIRADAWCAAFFSRKVPGPPAVTTASLRAASSAALSDLRVRASAALEGVNTFQWELEFAEVMTRGGFDVVVGNPPWDTLSPDVKEYFSAYDPSVRNVRPEQQAAIVRDLLRDPVLAERWRAHQRQLYGLALFLRESGQYVLYAPGNLGKGDFNTYRVFVELALHVVRPGGYIGQIAPDGLYMGANATAIRRTLLDQGRWHRLFGFGNSKEVWFKGVYYRSRFCVFAAQTGGRTESVEVAFQLNSVEALAAALRGGTTKMPADIIRRMSPETYAVPELANPDTLLLTDRLMSQWPAFGDESAGPPRRQYMRELDMGNDRDLFADRGEIPLYEGRMVGQFDHRAKGYGGGRGRTARWHDYEFGDPRKAVRPQWWVRSGSLSDRTRPRVESCRIGFCDVTSPTNERSLVAALIPPGAICGHKVPTILLEEGRPGDYMLWLAIANSLVMDFLVRRRISLQMSYTILDGMPFPCDATVPYARDLIRLAAELTCASDDMIAFWNLLAADGWVAPCSDGHVPGVVVPDERAVHRARLDAMVAVGLFGVTDSEMERILDDFGALRRREARELGAFRTRDLVLAEMARLQSAAPAPPALMLRRSR